MRATQLYDRRRDEVSLDEVERIVICDNLPTGTCEAKRSLRLFE
jgi:hypothetical protein